MNKCRIRILINKSNSIKQRPRWWYIGYVDALLRYFKHIPHRYY
jgi:hypothetical protein